MCSTQVPCLNYLFILHAAYRESIRLDIAVTVYRGVDGIDVASLFNVSNVRNPGSIKLRERNGLVELKVRKLQSIKCIENESKITDRIM
jgi:hypothetical protein